MTFNALINKIKWAKNLALELLFNCFPIKKNTVMFYSFNGQYNDNPKYISEALHEREQNVKIVWAMNKSSLGTQPDYVLPVLVGSVKYYYYSSVCAAYVDNYTGKHTFRKNKKLGFWARKLKRKKQFNISTWHGTPLKKIHNDINNAPISPEGCFTTCDLFLSGNRFLTKNISKNLCGNIIIREVGSPRNDLLVNGTDETIAKIKQKMNIPLDEKIVLYAPTFRDSVLDSGVYQLELVDVQKLLAAIQEKFGGKWNLAVRAHPGVFTELKKKYVDRFEEGILDANAFPDMAEYLLISDILITDYSGSLFDYCLLKRPCFLFAHDFEHYSQKERGLYFELDELPFTFSKSFKELLNNIASFDKISYEQGIKDFQIRIGDCENGKACAAAVEFLMTHLQADKNLGKCYESIPKNSGN